MIIPYKKKGGIYKATRKFINKETQQKLKDRKEKKFAFKTFITFITFQKS